MERLSERLRDAALQPSAPFDWDGALRRGTRRRRLRLAGMGVAVCVVLALVGVGVVALTDGDSGGGRVVATQPPATGEEVRLNERWLISPVPEGFTFEQIAVEEVPEVPPEIERQFPDLLVPRAETTTARFRSDDGGELVVTETFVDGMPLGPPAFSLAVPEGAIEEREIEFNDESVLARYLPAGSGGDQSLSWEFSEDNWFAIDFDPSLSFDDARAFAAALQPAVGPDAPTTTTSPPPTPSS